MASLFEIALHNCLKNESGHKDDAAFLDFCEMSTDDTYFGAAWYVLGNDDED